MSKTQRIIAVSLAGILGMLHTSCTTDQVLGAGSAVAGVGAIVANQTGAKGLRTGLAIAAGVMAAGALIAHYKASERQKQIAYQKGQNQARQYYEKQGGSSGGASRYVAVKVPEDKSASSTKTYSSKKAESSKPSGTPVMIWDNKTEAVVGGSKVYEVSGAQKGKTMQIDGKDVEYIGV